MFWEKGLTRCQKDKIDRGRVGREREMGKGKPNGNSEEGRKPLFGEGSWLESSPPIEVLETPVERKQGKHREGKGRRGNWEKKRYLQTRKKRNMPDEERKLKTLL